MCRGFGPWGGDTLWLLWAAQVNNTSGCFPLWSPLQINIKVSPPIQHGRCMILQSGAHVYDFIHACTIQCVHLLPSVAVCVVHVCVYLCVCVCVCVCVCAHHLLFAREWHRGIQGPTPCLKLPQAAFKVQGVCVCVCAMYIIYPVR